MCVLPDSPTPMPELVQLSPLGHTGLQAPPPVSVEERAGDAAISGGLICLAGSKMVSFIQKCKEKFLEAGPKTFSSPLKAVSGFDKAS